MAWPSALPSSIIRWPGGDLKYAEGQDMVGQSRCRCRAGRIYLPRSLCQRNWISTLVVVGTRALPVSEESRAGASSNALKVRNSRPVVQPEIARIAICRELDQPAAGPAVPAG